ncbi:MAG: DinB family protein, partial [Candidatus Rokubacteria bacterium]|nr:DinB family protein [Candidatus Rokubacteria bacterium]
MTDFDAALTGFAALDEEALGRPWSWRDGRLDVRYALYRTLEDAQEAYVRVSAGIHPESRRILALAQRAFGDLRSLLLGLPTDLLDTPPRAGEWPVRETLRHMLVVERRYALQTRYALERADAEPVRIPDD